MHSTMMSFPLTMSALFVRAERFFPGSEIVWRMPDKSVRRHTYADFARRTRALGRGLLELGLKKSQRVATLMWNHHAHLETYYAVPVIGGVLHTLNLRLHPDELTYIANHAEDRFLICDDVLWPLAEKFIGRTKIEKVLMVRLKGEGASGEDYERFLAAAGVETLELPELEESDAMGMCYTSGTTGHPKGVVYSHRAMALHTMGAALVDTLAISRRDVVLPVVPMFHANAWGIPYAATMVGAKLVMPGPHLDAESLLDLFEKEQVTLAAGVPTIWMGILEALEKHPGRWKLMPELRMVVGGSAAPEAMIRAFDRHGLRVVHAWGMTETTPLGSVANLSPEMQRWPEDQQYVARAKQGLPVPFVEVRAMGDSGEVPWDGQAVGELEVRGPWVTGSYYRLEGGGERFSSDGWFKTGDVVSIDRQGFIKITDRTKDLIKSGGEWISSVDLENALMGHPAVKEAAVVAVPHPKWTERPLAAVVLKDGKTATPDELRAYLEGKFSKWWLPDGFVFLATIPRTSAGKFKKSELREMYKDWRA